MSYQSLSEEDKAVLALCAEAVGHGTHDGIVPPELFARYEDIIGRLPYWDKEVGEMRNMNRRFTDISQTRQNLQCKGHMLFCGEAV